MLSGGWTELISSGDKEVENTIKLWDLKTERLLRTFKGHKNGVVSLAITDNGHRLISASLDGTIKTWDINTGRMLSNTTLVP